MNYSSGIFESPEADADDADKMHEASLRKMDQVCRKLQLNSLDHVLEIGTGWGGLAIHMAKTSGCRVTTTTISKEQHRFALERVRKEGLEDRITVLLQDYSPPYRQVRQDCLHRDDRSGGSSILR